MSRSKKQKHFPPFPWKNALRVLIFCFVFSAIFLIFNRLKNPDYFPITTVKVFGIVNVDPKTIQHSLKTFVQKGFFGIDVDNIKEQLLRDPWVLDANVRRIWPNQVDIRILEKTAIARWNNESLLSDKGDLFVPESNFDALKLPDFIAPQGKQFVLIDYFNKINSVLEPIHFKVLRLELTQDYSWSVTLDNGLKISAGSKDILTRLSHFVKVYPKIVGNRLNEVDYVDLRYSNGLAVKWKA